MKRLRDIGECALIERLCRWLPRGKRVLVGIGDDCAAVRAAAGSSVLLKTDAVVEGVHFDASATPYRIGWKAMSRAISDLAAMAGQPRWALVTAGLRGDLPVKFVEEIYRGLADAAGKFGAAIVGGETVRTPGPFWLNVALAGEVDPKRLRRRNAARVGDDIFVTGALGGSIHGRHLTFTPRVTEAQWLAKGKVRIHAMIDISDGLVRDLGHICHESGVGARLDAVAVPITAAAKGSLERALHDGEDFELLFTAPGRDTLGLLAAWRRRFPKLPLTRIGVIARGDRIEMIDETGHATPLNDRGYDHFRKSK